MLGELIEQRRADLGLSFADVADRATRAGYRLSLQTVHQLATRPTTNTPRTETIKGLAHALELGEGAVGLAVLESIGVKVESTVGNDTFTEGWVTLTTGRNDAQRRHLLRVARTAAEGLDLAREDEPGEMGAREESSGRGDRGEPDRQG